MKGFFSSKKPDPVLAILFLAVFMFLANTGDSTYNFHYSDTFLVIPSWVPSLLFGFHWLIYKAARNWLYNTSLVWIHYSMLVISYLLLFSGTPVGPMATSYIILLLILGLVVFIVNIILGITRKEKVV